MVVFEGTLKAARGGGAFVEIPRDAHEALDGGMRFRVRGSLNGVGLESLATAVGAESVYLGLHKATRDTAGVSVRRPALR